ncbi:MAG TPA: preprotein translocase subunit SecE [Candidatus Pacearchaeota archaeon]|nr:preprotein translocase subunit SecE [Candidatus Paceibacterota bacterium]HOK00772.1 preprotein translocase subunit SecE [Candidatus Pacearchaeota archaeon]HOL90588.1 preprotein translocase subunit SecE [Candidatus Pacearchaeota archaeon]HOW13158.1 preprotein translocase subunit SecE [Candidatus Pacearchaeota archaeon]HPO68326.1 preprotein translocase subunit SecE [Candidatus Pacearchaeota archaeon]
MKVNDFFQKIPLFLKEVRMEIKKINWPNRQEILKYVLIVIGVSLVVSIYLGGLDFIFTFLLQKFILK